MSGFSGGSPGQSSSLGASGALGGTGGSLCFQESQGISGFRQGIWGKREPGIAEMAVEQELVRFYKAKGFTYWCVKDFRKFLGGRMEVWRHKYRHLP